jgi:hypothetical protein
MSAEVTGGKYTIELCREGVPGAGIEEILDRHDDLMIARMIYRKLVGQHPCRLVMLCDQERILMRCDRPETAAETRRPPPTHKDKDPS